MFAFNVSGENHIIFYYDLHISTKDDYKESILREKVSKPAKHTSFKTRMIKKATLKCSLMQHQFADIYTDDKVHTRMCGLTAYDISLQCIYND